MKKLILMCTLVAFSFGAHAQFSLGANLGFPSDKASDLTSFSFGIDATYMLTDTDAFNYGFASNIQFYSGEDNLDNWSFLNIAGAARYQLSDQFSTGLDLGWSFGLNPDGNDGGLYWRPMVGYQLSDSAQLNLSYNAVRKTDDTISSFGLGIMFHL